MILCAIKSILANQLCHNTRFSSQVPKYNWWKSAFQFRNLSSKPSNSKNTLQMEAKFQKHTNRLINEKSPYLLQHAHNPVDWYPWGEEAIQRAKKENKLIFLSVGYSTCHWCHVMEKESFENEEVAAIMNEHYVNVKVDREERPDIDKLYMTFVLMVNGSGGWPMSVWMTPDLAPITCGTYFPPKDKWGVPGFSTILLKLKEKWDKDKDTLVETGKNVIDALRRNAVEKHKEEPPNILNPEGKFHQAVNIYRRNIDPIWGGTLGAPKFPEVSKLNLIFHCHQKEPKNKILGLVLNTLDKMQNGGIHDHIFGGFARYSVDKKWHVPHFEKMLYDQGQLLMVYANGYKINRNPKYLEVADKIYTYLVKDLLHPKGGFYSGEDADSLPTIDSQDKVEGAFYAWTYNEVRDIFEQNKEKFIELENYMNPLDVYCEHYNILEEGNVEPSSDPHGHLVEKNVFIVFGSENETAEKFDLPLETVRDILKIGNGLLHEVREQRPRPHLDTKIICGWNGLVLSGISQLATIRDAPRRSEYLKTAENLVNFIRENLFDSGNKKLLRSCYGDDTENAVKLEQPICGFLDDYSFLIKGLLDFYTASLDLEALHLAKDLQDIQDKLFWDEEEGGYFYSEANAENVVVRMKDDHDGAEPCGNSVSAYNLLLLADYFEDEVLKQRATKLFDHFKNVTPFGYVLPEMMSALLLKEYGHNNLIIAGPDDQESHELLDIVRDFYMPGLLIHHLKVDKPHIRLTKKSYENMKMVENKSTAYVCHHMRCHLPTTDPNELYNELKPIHIFEGKHEIE